MKSKIRVVKIDGKYAVQYWDLLAKIKAPNNPRHVRMKHGWRSHVLPNGTKRTDNPDEAVDAALKLKQDMNVQVLLEI